MSSQIFRMFSISFKNFAFKASQVNNFWVIILISSKLQFVQRAKSFEFLTFFSNNFTATSNSFNKIRFLLTHLVHFKVSNLSQIKGGCWSIVIRFQRLHIFKKGEIFFSFRVKIDYLCLLHLNDFHTHLL